MIKSFLLLAIILLASVQVPSQNITMSGIPTQDQIPTGDIIRTYQDSEGYMWYGTARGGLYRDDGYTVKVFRSSLVTPDLLESNSITYITEDKEHRIWFGTKRGAYILDKKDYKITPLTDDRIKSRVINTINATSDGLVWVSTENTLYKYNMQKEIVGTYILGKKDTFRSVRIYSFYEDPNRIIWVTQWNGGIFRYDPEKDSFISYPWNFPESPTCILKDVSSPYYWVGTWGKGVVRFDPNEKVPQKVFVLQDIMENGCSIDERQINSMAQDSVYNYIWTTAMDDLHTYKVTDNYSLQPVEVSAIKSSGKKIMHDIRSDRSGYLWVSGYYPRSFIISFQSEAPVVYKIPRIKEETGIPATPVKIIYDKGQYWMWQMRIGICNYQTSNGNFLPYYAENLLLYLEKSESMDGIYAIKGAASVVLIQNKGNKITESTVCILPLKQHESIRTLHEDNSGNLWIGTGDNLFRYKLKTKETEVVWENTGIVNDIVSSINGNVYVATESNGFLKLAPDGNKQQYHPHDEDNYVSLSITDDQSIWARTEQNRIYFYNSKDNSFDQKTFEYDLTNEVIYEMECDSRNNLWILTDQKIIVYNPGEDSYRLIRATDPQIHLDNFLSMYKDDEGKMHVGGSGGICVFPSLDPPEKINDKTHIGLTDIKVNGVNIYPDSNSIILEPHEQNIELFFSTFNPVNSGKVRFAFRRRGQESYWNYLPVGQNNIYLTELPKGRYDLEIKATDENGLWNNHTLILQIERLPAWYETWWAYMLYTVVFLVILIIMIRRYVEFQKKKQETAMKEHIAQIKYRFFTNVSHELRTPLTLIITPLGALIRKVSDPVIRKQLESINRNAYNLLILVNQLLDFRKVEMGGETLSLTKGDINAFLVSVYENFLLTISEKKLHFEYHSDINSLFIFFDHDKLRKIVNNLLSNAIKFTPESGEISLRLSEKQEGNKKYVIISVADTGIGIPADEQYQIFERFHQVGAEQSNTGSGIGLHIAKEYTVMHQGRISVQSEVGKGSVFTVCMPADLMSENKLIHEIDEAEITSEDLDKSGNVILVVDDNEEFRSYMSEELSHYYTVYEAANGIEGEKTAIEQNPDIIITDLMMPEMDGMELCRRVKNNINISHIPVMLLTANDNLENERMGYKEGADAYIGKPFHWDILLFRIRNLLEQRRERQESFGRSIKINTDQITISSADDKLLQQALILIEENISNSEYSIEDLSNDMAMSRTTFYRKINSITGLTPTDFVRNIRLKKAAELLKRQELTIAEVAYNVGFSTPAYFTQAFKKEFGMLPSQFK
ncbi:hybrid sensor histidine kinase/response regulator transcription factor [Dysgonomonas macrotermitis]|uniref:histidine kinase n=1 Tax=Dysgonomonas macrotermitis TaxID=1346286 RepID=A0A1M4X750_9BACT|nr:ATP-binding protein [Dysgonomonas macrotermitis]SHE89287.1 Signal transduction histidine kinase [Dysgonomonas macrotermitis]